MATKNPIFSLSVNLGLLLLGSAMILSGLLIQVAYHMGHHGEIDANNLVLGLNYFIWSDIHKILTVLVSMGMVFHIVWHWKWFKGVVRKKKSVFKNQQSLLLTTIFLLVAVTGYLSWFIRLSGGSKLSSRYYIEIHDKITWLLLVYLIFHVAKRFKWYFTAFKKVTKYREGRTDMVRPVQTLETRRK